MKRQIIKIDNEKCNGCGACVPGCAEGALQIVDGKARLISDLFCDGLGACIGQCPQEAITFEEREAEAYDEIKTLEENIIPAGENTLRIHLKHMLDHNETEIYNQAVAYLKEKGMENPLDKDKKDAGFQQKQSGGCPGSRMMDLRDKKEEVKEEDGKRASHLKQWPVQLHLVSPYASYFKGSDLLLAADCVAFSLADFHKDYLKDKSLAIACPKLDTGREIYIDKIKTMIDESKLNTITVMMMEVPCCGGLLSMAKEAKALAGRNIPIKKVLVGINGDILSEDWV